MSTSYIERANLTMRMHCRRLTRLTNAYSKSLKHMKAAIALLVAVMSQPPAPSSGNQGQQTQQEPASGDNRAESPNQQGAGNVSITIQTPPASGQTTEPNENRPNQQGEPTPNWWDALSGVSAMVWAGAAVVMIGVTIGLLVVAHRQRQTSETQGKILSDTLATNEATERAYVDMSHFPPGLENIIAGATPRVRIGVKNHGRTPGKVTRIYVELVTGTLPRNPTYNDLLERAPQEAILMPRERFILKDPLLAEPFPEGDAAHASVLANNLIIEQHPGYNYDIEIDEQGNPISRAQG